MNQWLDDHRTLLFGAVGVLLAGSIGLFAVRYQPPEAIAIIPPVATTTPLPSATPGPIKVYVSGAVNRPAVYEVPPDSIVQDVLAIAGGPTVDADLSRINLAMLLRDGDQVHVPSVGELATATPEEPTATPTPSGPININTATASELEWLPGIGPTLSQRIIDYRDSHGNFSTIQQIMNVSGIGPGTFANIRNLITVCDDGTC